MQEQKENIWGHKLHLTSECKVCHWKPVAIYAVAGRDNHVMAEYEGGGFIQV